MNSRKITFLALLASSTIVGRIFFQSLPNVQPVTTVLIFSAIYLGITEAMLLNIIILTISNIYLGFGVWTIYQVVSYSLIILIAYFLASIPLFKENLILQTIFLFLSGFIYGFIISIIYALFFSKVTNFWTYYFYGLAFDFFHAIGNLFIYIILTPILLKIIDSYFNKNNSIV